MRADGVDIPVECPGPSIYAVQGDTITISITNTLDEAHSFFIPGVFDSGPIAPALPSDRFPSLSASRAPIFITTI
jgi:FtsP/CotA-like multicopper oxidase with cupredoxin domain